MVSERSGFEHIDHTADAGIRATAPDLSQLFENAATGLFDLILNLKTVDTELTRNIRVTATDREALLVAWLSELNYQFLTSRTVFADFQVQEIGETSLVAAIRGEPLDLTKHEIYTEVKAVTYHGLYIKETTEGFEAQIIFDL